MSVGNEETFLIGAPEGYKTVNNVSSINQLITANLSGLQYVFLGDAQISDDIDFNATSVAMKLNAHQLRVLATSSPLSPLQLHSIVVPLSQVLSAIPTMSLLQD